VILWFSVSMKAYLLSRICAYLLASIKTNMILHGPYFILRQETQAICEGYCIGNSLRHLLILPHSEGSRWNFLVQLGNCESRHSKKAWNISTPIKMKMTNRKIQRSWRHFCLMIFAFGLVNKTLGI
jgi:hypothetical protein